MKKVTIETNYDAKKLGFIALISFLLSVLFKGAGRKSRKKGFVSRFLKNFSRTSAMAAAVSSIGFAKKVRECDEKGELTFEEAAKKYNEASGKTVIDIDTGEG